MKKTKRKSRKKSANALLPVAILAAAIFIWLSLPEKNPGSSSVPASGTLTVTYLDVGQADSILLQSEGESMLIDGGNRNDKDFIIRYLTEQGIQQLDYAVATHPHEDHIGGLSAVVDEFNPKTVWMSDGVTDTATYDRLLTSLENSQAEVSVPTPGTTTTLGSCQVTVLGPTESYQDLNNTSLVLRVTCGDTAFLFTGDQEADAEEDLLHWAHGNGYPVTADVLKLGHHGSSTSSSEDFLAAVAPTYCIISCGVDNYYGHPHQETLDKMDAGRYTVYRTDTMGTITAVSDGSSITFTTDLNQRSS